MTASHSFLGTSLPIIQAPMAGSQGHALAVAVSNAGGLGSLPSALLSTEALRNELETFRAHTGAPFNLNFFCHTPPTPSAEREAAWRATLAPYYKEYGIDPATIPSGPGRTPFNAESLALIEAFRPAVVSFHFGLPPADLLVRVRATGAKILSSATTLDEARWLEAQGANAIIVQGLEAGGHRGHFLSPDLTLQGGTFALLPQVVRAVKVPVIAAGGIVDAQSVKAALALGASAVQVGTTYLLCPETLISRTYRAALKSQAAQHTAVTNLFSGRPARGIVNRLMRDLGPLSDRPPEFPLAGTALAPLRAKAEAQGRGDFSPLWAGQNVTGCREIPAAELTRQLMGVGS
jgi:nitronate monooxygenase